MNPEYRKKLLALQAHVDQLIAEAEELLAGQLNDDEVLSVSKQLKELRGMLAEVEIRLNNLN
jgi:hypothetical protein